MTEAPALSSPGRLLSLDCCRGFAILLMVVFHFCYDLVWLWKVPLGVGSSVPWRLFQILIVLLFLLAVGGSLYLSRRRGKSRFWRRQLQLLGSAALVSAATYPTFQEHMVFFGILHFIFLASLLAFPLAMRKWTCLLLGMLALGFGLFFRTAVFNAPYLLWLGMATSVPTSVDYVPLLPWIGVVFIAIFLAHYNLWGYLDKKLAALAYGTSLLSLLRWMGQRSLWLYLLHQPLLLAFLYPLYLLL